MAASSQFEFAAWCEEYELEAETIKALTDRGFKSYKSVSKLTPDMVKKDFKGLLPAQVLLLQDAVSLLNPASAAPPASGGAQPDAQPDASATLSAPAPQGGQHGQAASAPAASTSALPMGTSDNRL
jgi:hypothetical protein